MRYVCMAGAALVAIAGAAQAEILDPPGEPFNLFSTNSNDGYTGGRGAVFTADNDFTITDVGWHNNMPVGSDLTFNLYKVTTTNGNLLDGTETLLASQGMTTSAEGLAAHQTFLDSPVDIEAGMSYLLQIMHDASGVENYFYEYDPDIFGDPPFMVGNVTVIDGTASGNTSNFVMPRMEFNEIPAPGAMALLGLGGLAATRRRR